MEAFEASCYIVKDKKKSNIFLLRAKVTKPVLFVILDFNEL
jgi:hypothetical protein